MTMLKTIAATALIALSAASAHAAAVQLGQSQQSGEHAVASQTEGSRNEFLDLSSTTATAIDQLKSVSAKVQPAAIVVPPSDVPEPASFALVGAALMAGVVVRRRRK